MLPTTDVKLTCAPPPHISALMRLLRTFYNLALSKLNLALNGHQRNTKRSVGTLLFGTSSDDILIVNAIKNTREGKREQKSRQWEVEGKGEKKERKDERKGRCHAETRSGDTWF